MASTMPNRLGALAVHSLNFAQRPLARGMATSIRPSVLRCTTRISTARTQPSRELGAGKMLVKHYASTGTGVTRSFSSSSKPRPDDHTPHEHKHEHKHEHDHSDKRNETEAKVVDNGKPQSFWRKMLNVRQWGIAEVGTAATILCAIDCTVFPVVLTALPLAQLIDPATSHHLAHVTHAVALYFVLPIGSLAVGTNFVQHKRWDIASLGAAGVLTIAAAHMNVFPEWVNAYEAWVNTVGCAGLLASGWWSHRVLHQHGGHSHCHGTPDCHAKPKSK